MFRAPSLDQQTASKTDLARARGAALRLLALRARSVDEVRQRLAQRFGQPVVEQTLARLVEDGLLDDAAFASQWRQSRERRKPRSRGMIERELKQRGVSAEIIEGALEDFDAPGAAYRAAARYASRQAEADRATFDRRVGAFLGRRGFEPGVIRETLAQLRQELMVGASPGEESADH